MIMSGPIGVAVAAAIQARLWVTHDTQDARLILLQHVDDYNADASAKDLRPSGSYTARYSGVAHELCTIGRAGRPVSGR
jgi:hypothetical protein